MSGRVLVIEDNATNLDFIAYLLGAFGYQILAAADGEEGLRVARRERPDIIICDVQLPGVDGYEVARRLKGDPAFRELPLIAVTAYAMVGDRERLIAAGFDGYIAKPIEPEMFVSKIETMLGASRQPSISTDPAALPGHLQPRDPGQARATILVIDDHATNRELLKTILGYQGHRILEAGDARDALKIAQEERPDLIITDILMPTMDGFEFVRHLRGDLTIGKTPVVLSSAYYLSRETENLARACGVVHILPKPSEPETILQIVELALASRSTEKPALSNDFTREHVRVVTSKLAEKVEELRAANQRLTDLNELVRHIGSEPNSHRLLEAFCRGVRGVIGARFASLGVIDETGQTQLPLIFSGMPNLPIRADEQIAGPDSLIGKSLTVRQSCRAADLEGDPRLVGLPTRHPCVRFAICAPIASPSRTYGWICLSEKVGVGRFSAEDEELLGSLAAQVGRAYENNILLTQLQQRAAELEREITERKRIEQALRESETRYRTVGEAIPYGVWVCDPQGGIEYVSQSFLDLIGKTLDEVKPRGWLDRLPPEDVKPTLHAWRACVRAGGEWKCEHRVKAQDGTWRTILSLGRPVRDAQDRITSWGGFNLDISERRQAEDELSRQFGLLTAITDSAADAIFVSDREGRVTLVNAAAERIFGWSRQELTGRKLHDTIHDRHPDGRPYPASECPLSLVYDTGETLLRHEDVFFRKDGSQVPVACSNAPLMIDGRIAGSVLVAHDISNRKRAERALRESEARLRRTVEYAPFPIMVHAEDGEVVHLSQAWLDLTGYTRDEIGTITRWTERAYGERKGPVRAGIDRLYAIDRTVDEGEYTIGTADGRTRVWAFNSAPLGRDDRGRRLVVSMAADVTERKEAEDALRENESRMRALLDASQDEILLLNTHGEVLAINKAAQQRLAKRTGGLELVGAHLNDLLPRDQVASRMAIVRQVASSGTLVHCDTPIRSRWFEFWFYPVFQPDRPVSEVAVYAREITQQKKSQADLGKLFQAVQQSPMSVVITDRQGNIEYANPEFTQVTGYTLAEAVGQNPRILKSGQTPPEQYAEIWNTISAGGVWRGELLNKRKNGELFWELASIAPVKQGENITNFVAVKEDITERKQMEEQLRQSQKMQALGQLTGGIAHDFNNLLAIVMGNLQLLEERIGKDAKNREYLDDALWSARRGGELTHRLLAFARKQPLKPTVINLNEVVQQITDLLRRTLGMGVHIEESLAPDLWAAFADRGELERALVNLAVNARDAMRSSGTLTLETRNAVLDEYYVEQYEELAPGEYVLLAVTDTGSGMPPEITERVFEPFFTTKEVGQGSGLGLSMVYGFVKQSGGHVSIYSRVGQGTSVKLYLPRAPSSAARPEQDAPDMSPEDLRKKVVLVVEDEPKLRKVAVKMLQRLGPRSMQAETANDALKFLAEAHVDLLFTDIELPGNMNGTELAEAARKLDPEIKVLFTTGYAREAVLHDEWSQKKTPWLLKPYSHRELARELKALLLPTCTETWGSKRLQAQPRVLSAKP